MTSLQSSDDNGIELIGEHEHIGEKGSREISPNIDRRRTLLVALITALSGGFPSSAAGSSSDVGSHDRSEG
jgi:hypothetical protein